eukprot:5083988-Karenia_brevis.AAC.1
MYLPDDDLFTSGGASSHREEGSIIKSPPIKAPRFSTNITPRQKLNFDLEPPRQSIPIPANNDLPNSGYVAKQVTIAEIASLLDEKLAPVTTSINQIERKLEAYREQSQQEIWEVRCTIQDELHEVVDQWQMEFDRMKI